MNQPIISVQGIGKRYKLGATHGGRTYKTMRDSLARIVKVPTRLFIKSTAQPFKTNFDHDYIWALRNVSFDMQQGEVLGIIGRNGAGKSTMLKILSQITDPTEGEIRLFGRVASLLEVGTGFHPELTGRENVYLNGAILGMTRVEIKKKFDEIVSFAGVEKFLETPVKRYSSGMYVRLAFAVAAHLEPEILIVDEVLSVGDAEFQKKCLGKMQDVSKREGRTVLFVSHNMSAIQSLCNRVIVLKSGQVCFSGQVLEGINNYLNEFQNDLFIKDLKEIDRKGTRELIITKFLIKDLHDRPLGVILSGTDVMFEFQYEKKQYSELSKLSFGFSIHNSIGETLSILYSDFDGSNLKIDKENGAIKCIVKKFPFAANRYFIGIRVLNNGIVIDYPKQLIGCFDVEEGDFYGSGRSTMNIAGPFLLKGHWSVL